MTTPPTQSRHIEHDGVDLHLGSCSTSGTSGIPSRVAAGGRIDPRRWPQIPERVRNLIGTATASRFPPTAPVTYKVPAGTQRPPWGRCHHRSFVAISDWRCCPLPDSRLPVLRPVLVHPAAYVSTSGSRSARLSRSCPASQYLLPTWKGVRTWSLARQSTSL